MIDAKAIAPQPVLAHDLRLDKATDHLFTLMDREVHGLSRDLAGMLDLADSILVRIGELKMRTYLFGRQLADDEV